MGDAKSTYTVDDALLSMGFGKFQAFVLAYSGMAKISEAMEMMLLSFVGPSVQTEWELSPHEESLISSVVFIGMFVGAYSWGIVSDKYGRRQVFSRNLQNSHIHPPFPFCFLLLFFFFFHSQITG